MATSNAAPSTAMTRSAGTAALATASLTQFVSEIGTPGAREVWSEDGARDMNGIAYCAGEFPRRPERRVVESEVASGLDRIEQVVLRRYAQVRGRVVADEIGA